MGMRVNIQSKEFRQGNPCLSKQLAPERRSPDAPKEKKARTKGTERRTIQLYILLLRASAASVRDSILSQLPCGRLPSRFLIGFNRRALSIFRSATSCFL